jgi:hypothetical protein
MFKKNIQNDNRFYKLDINEIEKKKSNRMNWCYFAGMLFFWVMAGLVNQDSSRTFYVLFPYYFIFLPIIYFGYGVLNLSGLSNVMDGVAYDGSIRRMHRSGLGIIIWTGINVLLDIIYIIINFKTANIGKEILYCLPLIGIIVVGFFFARYYDRNYAKLTMQNS